MEQEDSLGTKLIAWGIPALIILSVWLYLGSLDSKWRDKECKKECSWCETYTECDECFYTHQDLCEN